MSVIRMQTIAMQGMESVTIDVQVQMSTGLPRFVIVGLPDAVVCESRIRITSALSACLPPRSIVVNLSPSHIKKEGSHYDLPIALCLLAAMKMISEEFLQSYISLGGLSLDGEIMPVKGVLSAAIHANMLGKGLICPKSCIKAAMLAGGDIRILAPENLLELINYCKNSGNILTNQNYVPITIKPEEMHEEKMAMESTEEDDLTQFSVGYDHIAQKKSPYIDGKLLTSHHKKHIDWADIKGQESAKRASLIALSGDHHLLLIGSPGSGKSMLAHSFADLLPDLAPDIALETTIIHNLRGNIAVDLVLKPPFREPHHGASMPALIGGGQKLLPGEISLANGGILFMDEFPEFNKQALDSLREPMESGVVTVSRASGSVKYPARFQLVAAMNPCKCGMSDDKICVLGEKCRQLYMSRISGPLLDRFDICVQTKKLMPWELSDMHNTAHILNSDTARNFITLAKNIQNQRQQCFNVALSNQQLQEMIDIIELKLFLEKICKKYELSGRGYYRMLRVARTIDDLKLAENILKPLFHQLNQMTHEQQQTYIKHNQDELIANAPKQLIISKEAILEAVSYRI